MKITNKVILDLLPLYQAGEASADTKDLIENYFKRYPEFAKEVDELLIKQLPEDIPLSLKPEDEMVILKKTKRLLTFVNGECYFLHGITVFFWRCLMVRNRRCSLALG
ncbi:MAG: hypothetical protein GWP19_10070 [Planctomycetia bacterium]|nr:hypothetical protein [Planctomycetia bacterium]